MKLDRGVQSVLGEREKDYGPLRHAYRCTAIKRRSGLTGWKNVDKNGCFVAC